MTASRHPLLGRRGPVAFRWELALVAVTAVWGATFVVVRDAVAQVPPFTFIAYRFLAAAALLAAVRPRLVVVRQEGLPRAGVVAGAAVFAGYGSRPSGCSTPRRPMPGSSPGWQWCSRRCRPGCCYGSGPGAGR